MLEIAGKKFNSRLLMGTGKFSSNDVMHDAIIASESEIATVAIRRVELNSKTKGIVDYIPKGINLLPNTSGARNADEAIRIARLCKMAAGTNWVKLEVISDPVYLLPDPIETLKAAEQLVKEEFVVLPYINADPMLAKHLEEAGCATVMPLGSPIGTNKGLKTVEMIKIIIDICKIPVVVDAGIGKPSDAAYALELGADAVLVNTAIAVAKNPVEMAKAFKMAVTAGRMAYESGLGDEKDKGEASSPLT
ncbi:MAG: thiazole synthase, partial [Nitrospinota bacterium]|nr:thiazole synthase [Nitrospinota bacterium]